MLNMRARNGVERARGAWKGVLVSVHVGAVLLVVSAVLCGTRVVSALRFQPNNEVILLGHGYDSVQSPPLFVREKHVENTTAKTASRSTTLIATETSTTSPPPPPPPRPPPDRSSDETNTNKKTRTMSLSSSSSSSSMSSTGGRKDTGFVSGSASASAAKFERDNNVYIEQLSWKPRAYVVHNLATPEECDMIVNIAKPKMERSTVLDPITGESKDDPIRTSYQTFLPESEHRVDAILERISKYTGVPVENGEELQVLRYQNGQKYDEHTDIGAPGTKSGEELSRRGGERVATVLLYLTDVEEGGETTFPDGNWIGAPPNVTFSKCASYGPSVKPRKGNALIFYSIDHFGEGDMSSTHAGCPVIKGTKWTATRWLHQGSWRKASPPPPKLFCDDRHEMCRSWARHGECEKNPSFMVGTAESPGSCAKACGKCDAHGKFIGKPPSPK